MVCVEVGKWGAATVDYVIDLFPDPSNVQSCRRLASAVALHPQRTDIIFHHSASSSCLYAKLPPKQVASVLEPDCDLNPYM